MARFNNTGYTLSSTYFVMQMEYVMTKIGTEESDFSTKMQKKCTNSCVFQIFVVTLRPILTKSV